MPAYVMFLVHRRAGLEWRRYLPADHAFYAGKDYYYPAKISRLKAAAAKLVMGIAARAIKAMGPGASPGRPRWRSDAVPHYFSFPCNAFMQDRTARDQSRELLDEARRGRAIDDFMIEGDRQA